MKKIHRNQIHIIGSKNSGKTYLMQFLIKWFSNKNIKVGAIKHSSHTHPLDKEGSDSDKFYNSGADPVTFITREGMSLVSTSQSLNDEILGLTYKDCDLLLVESYKETPNDKIVIEPENLEFNEENIIAVVTNNEKSDYQICFTHDDTKLCEFLIEKYDLSN